MAPLLLTESEPETPGELERWRAEAPLVVLPAERIRSMLEGPFRDEGEVVRAGPVAIDPVARDVRVDGRHVALSLKEYELLAALAREPRRAWTKAELLRDVWEYRSHSRTRTLDSHASRLRRKLRAVVDLDLVENVWGVGYRLLPAYVADAD